ncbi:MaoC family dehydratase [Aquamicrobium sp. LC103]|uniref:MaoC family dehydratase n=1 Tax=Aquamicrobium sp. LC103 TaxID=1120658 RepID=UPI0009E4F972|nr:MaoC family dehydratase [Aquamicrobium sp. LC103]TKT75907.1 MaoC family dehydratase [Aquamicrobium sp. LC103]
MGIVFSSVQEAVAALGKPLGHSDWLTIEQPRIDEFARATGDFQWIHVNPDKARDGPFGRTVAHGYLTFSLINMFLPELWRAEGMKMAVNYGADRLRFPAPVPVGSRVRAVGELVKAESIDENTVQTTVRVTMELEGSPKPGCVADIMGRYYF